MYKTLYNNIISDLIMFIKVKLKYYLLYKEYINM